MAKFCPMCGNEIIDPNILLSCPKCGIILPPYPIERQPTLPNGVDISIPKRIQKKGFIPTVTIDKGLGKPENANDVNRVLSQLDPVVLSKLYGLSRNTGQVVYVFSGYRPALTPFEKKENLSAHQFRLAVDVTIPGYNSEQAAYELWKVGFTGLGVKRSKKGFLLNTAHGDIRGDPAADGTPFAKDQVLVGRALEKKDLGKPVIWDEVRNDKGGWNDSTRGHFPPPPTPTPSPQTPITPETPVITETPVTPTSTLPPQSPVTPVTQSIKTQKWIAICCGGAIILVIGLVLIGQIYNSPSLSSGSSSPTYTSYTQKDPIIGVWSCSNDNTMRYRFNADGTYVESINYDGAMTLYGTWSGKGGNSYITHLTGTTSSATINYDPAKNSFYDTKYPILVCTPYQGDVEIGFTPQSSSTSSGTTSGSSQTTAGDCKPGSALCQARYVNEHGWVGY